LNSTLEFSPESYRNFFAQLKLEFDFHKISEYERGCGVYLRHDVDLCVTSALNMAILEQELGIFSTYYFMVSSSTYNLLNLKNTEMVKTISEMGHEVGLHFDSAVHASKSTPLNSTFGLEIELLQNVLGKSVTSFSLHNPSVNGFEEVGTHLISAYDQTIFPRDIYISDSRMQFRSDVIDTLRLHRKERAQLLLHPIHFSGGKTYVQILCKMINRNLADLDLGMLNNSGYVNQGKRLPIYEI
jgi:hypothetical protein